MAHAFVVDYSFFNHDDNMERCPIVAMADYGYAEHGNGHECNFTLVFDWVRTHRCYYQTSEEYQAKVLVRLLNQVSKFYAYRQVHDYVNSASSNCLTESDVTEGLLLAKKRLEHMGTREDYRLYGFNTPEQQYLHENIPFHISEIDTNENQDFNPCFFKQEYKLYDENVGPLYVAVVLERENNGTEDKDLFSFSVKFIGSVQPLSNIMESVPLLGLGSDERLYEQKKIDFKQASQESAEELTNKIFGMISNPDFAKHLKTYDYYTGSGEWVYCEPIRRGIGCPTDDAWRAWGVGKMECHNHRCHSYKEDWTKQTHYAEPASSLFKKAFGKEIAELVKKGKLTAENISLMPDVTNPDFIKAFQTFCEEEKIPMGKEIHTFDEDGGMQYRKGSLDSHIRNIQKFASTSGYDIWRFETPDGESHTIRFPTACKYSEIIPSVIQSETTCNVK